MEPYKTPSFIIGLTLIWMRRCGCFNWSSEYYEKINLMWFLILTFIVKCNELLLHFLKCHWSQPWWVLFVFVAVFCMQKIEPVDSIISQCFFKKKHKKTWHPGGKTMTQKIAFFYRSFGAVILPIQRRNDISFQQKR